MPDALPWWVLPSAAALILVATHTYLGLHVISRNVFFVDLALAQVAALGSTVSYLYGFEMDDPVTYYVSLLFAVFGAWFFSAARVPDNRVPQEAIIGLAFAVASAGAILLSAENPHGAEHLRDMMAGSILVVSAHEVKHAAVMYGLIGIFHWIFRRRFLLISMNRDEAVRSGVRVQLWDFLFYLSFAIIITSSVRIAGVLLVFVLLIAPAVCGAMFATGIRSRLLIGWGCGILATIGGLVLSLHMDWPPAPAISCIFACILVGSAVVGNVLLAEHRGRAIAKYAGIGALLVGLGLGLTTFLRSELAWSWKAGDTGAGDARAGVAHPTAGTLHSHGEPEHPSGRSRADLLAALMDEHDQVRASAAENLGKLKDASVVPNLVAALQDPSAAVKEKAAQALGVIARREAAAPLTAALHNQDQDEWVNLREADALVRCGGADGMAVLLKMASDADAKLVRLEALRLALAFAGHAAPSSLEGPAGAEALASVSAWWTANQSSATWNAANARFVVAR
jgi:zinc/manganese transport system permease protein